MGSVKEEITRLETAKKDIETAIETCGVNVPDTELIDTYASYIRQIPSAVFSGLNVDPVGGADQFIQSIKQTNGLIEATVGGLVSTSNSGLVPKADGNAGVINSPSDDYVLTYKGGTVDWYKLPANAFKNDDNNTTYTLSGTLNGNAYDVTLTPSSGSATGAKVPAMGAASSSAAGTAGLVPAPAKNQHNSFLRGDGTWVVPDNTTYSVMTGATASAAGKSGLVPQPAKGDQGKFLSGAGTWTALPSLSITDSESGNAVTDVEVSGHGITLKRGTTFSVNGHKHSSDDITALTSYIKATTVAAIASTDSLNTALGKLELKADTAYNLVKGAYDGDGTIENLTEILKVLEGISDTDTIKAIIGKYLPLAGGTMTGNITFDTNRMIRWHQSDSYSISCPTGGDGAYLLLKAHNGITAKKRLSIYTNAESLPNTKYNLYTDGSLYAASAVFGGNTKITGGSDLTLQASSGAQGDAGDIVFSDYSGAELGRIWLDSTASQALSLRYGANDAVKRILHSGNSSVSKSGQTLTVKINGVEQSITNSTYTTLPNPYNISFKDTSNNTVTYNGSSALDLTGGIYYAVNASKASTLDCFTRRATANCTWGTLTASNGYTPIYWGDSASGGGIGFSDKGGQTFMQIDGDYYAQEGAYKVWHAGNLTKVSQLSNDAGYLTSLPSHVHTYIQSKDNYTFTASTLPNSFDWGVSAGFVADNAGYGSYGSVLTVRTYTGGGGTLQLYAPYSKTYGGTRLKARFGDYDKSNGNSWTDLKEIAWTSDIPTVTNYYWANVQISDKSNSGTSPTFANATTTGLLTVSTGGSHCGIKAGSTYINSINSDLILQNNGAIRFGTDSWDYNCWAGLKYVHSSKTISLGLADGTHFTANAAQSGGTMQFPGISNFILNGTVRITPQLGNYQEGIRIQPKDSWSILMLLGTDTTAAAEGTSAKSWGIFNSDGNFYINRNGSSTHTGYELCNIGGNWGIGNTNPSYKLHVAGDTYTSGWSRSANGFYVHDTGVHFTHQGSLGEIDMTSNNEFLWGSSSGDLYFNYRAVSRGTTVTHYRWHAGSSSTYATHTLGALTANGNQTLYGLTSTCNAGNDASYTKAAMQIREYNFGGSQSDTWAIAPRLAWHWSGRVQAQIGLASDNHLYISEDGNFSSPKLIIHSGNIGSQSVNYANSAGSAVDQTARDSAAAKLPLAGGTMTGPVTITYNSYPGLTIHNNTTSGESSIYIKNNTAGWALGVNPWSQGAGVFAIGQYSGTGSSNWRFKIDNNGYCYTSSYLNLGGGHEKNASSPTYVWGSNSSDNYLRSYQTGSLSVNYANSAGSASYAHYLPTKYDGGQQTNPQKYFNNGIGLRVAMTGMSSKGTSYWSDTLWINGYSGGDVPNMCALHFNRDGTPRAFISAQSNQSTSYGTFYELITGYNIGDQSVNYATSAGSAGDANTLDGYDSSAFAKIGTYNNLTHSGNEFTFASSAFSGDMWINYRTASGSLDGAITGYYFGDGKGGNLAKITAGNFSGNSNSASKLILTSCYGTTTNGNLWSTIKTGTASYLGTATVYEVYDNGGPDTYGEVLDIVSVHNSHWQPQLWFGSGKAGRLRYRNKDYNDNSWGDWKTVAWTSEIPSVGNGTVTINQAGASKGSFTLNQSAAATINLTDTNYYPTAFSWTGGTTAGPTGSLTGVGMSPVSFGAIPSASNTASGIVTTAAQEFAGQKTFRDGIRVGYSSTDHSSNKTKIYFGDGSYVWIGEASEDDAFTIYGQDYVYINTKLNNYGTISSSNYTTYPGVVCDSMYLKSAAYHIGTVTKLQAETAATTVTQGYGIPGVTISQTAPRAGKRAITITNSSGFKIFIHAPNLSALFIDKGSGSCIEHGFAYIQTGTSFPYTLSTGSSLTFYVIFGYVHTQGSWNTGDFTKSNNLGGFTCSVYASRYF